ncbi:MAG: 50S ribosomal protein L28 [Sphingobacteriales bacterium]|jgi:large subunit ribosomal protein L28|nr:50S ribosomal protein L28 [Sphingobacteriales bacterium]MCC7222519.1 50S ribosomal protein L28 [Chitinophagales bacterium]
MARVCELTGKRPITGNKVSHSNRKTKRWFKPNLQKKKFYIPEDDMWVEVKIATSAIRTINKKGISAYLRDLAR